MIVKRILAVLLVLCMIVPTAYAEEDKMILDSIGSWFKKAVDDSSEWLSQAWDDSADWVSKAWDDTSMWVGQAWKDSSAWVEQAWYDSSAWVTQAWDDSSSWVASNWSEFIVWINMLTSENPYAWVSEMILTEGILAYDSFVDLRSFLRTDPTIDDFHEQYNAALSGLSLLNEDKDILWDVLQSWASEKKVPFQHVLKLALPFLYRLQIEGEAAIGEEIAFSGSVVSQYLITVLETMKLDSKEAVAARLNKLDSALESMVRPVIVGDNDQNIMITDDKHYIVNFTFDEGKYQVILDATPQNTKSEFPLINGKEVEQVVELYFQNAILTNKEAVASLNGNQAVNISFSAEIAESAVTGKAVAVWAPQNTYVLFVLTNQEWSNEEYEEWLSSLSLDVDGKISFEVDLGSDGSFYGINQASQKYTISRYVDEEKFMVPKVGHGWAAERGNNLIDNIKGIFKGEHSTVIGDNNVKDGADRLITRADGSTLLIQSKYYSSASRSIDACFRDGQFRYVDADGKPMTIEVPADQYDRAVQYMENHIRNGEVSSIDPSDTARAKDIVRKGNLTYQQARHIAKAGTVESILYDSAHACVTAGTSMGLSAAVDFAVNLWNGEPIETAIKSSIYQGLKTGGTSFIISVLSSQVAKTGLNTAMIPASRVIAHALGPKVSAVIVNAFRPAGNAIYGAAAMQSAAKVLRGNTITAVVSFIVLSAEDIADIIQGRISWTQLAKNMSTTAVSITGGILSALGGAALGSIIMPGAAPVIGVTGLIFSIAGGWGAHIGADALADLIADDDADKMLDIITDQFSQIATEYFLNEEEVNQSIDNLEKLLSANMLKEMYQYHDHVLFARRLIEMSIDPVVASREYIELPSEEEYSEYVVSVLEEIYEDIDTETSEN